MGPPFFLIDRGVAGHAESVYRPAGPWECALTGAREMISDLEEPGPILVTSNVPCGVSGPYLCDPLKCIDGASAATN